MAAATKKRDNRVTGQERSSGRGLNQFHSSVILSAARGPRHSPAAAGLAVCAKLTPFALGVALIGALACPAPAFAQSFGGSGGNGNLEIGGGGGGDYANSGTSGTSSNVSGSGAGGGGGGGTAAAGGAGGNDYTNAGGGAAGAANGGAGGNATTTDAGGGGGGGGALGLGLAGSGNLSNFSATGGTGGSGGSATNGGGGGGGSGGSGVATTNQQTTVSITGTSAYTGGNGGAGGSSTDGVGGNGGDGGAGVTIQLSTGSSLIIGDGTNVTTITGGNGGAAGSGACCSLGGNGGAGIEALGTSVSITLNANATVTGGSSAGGVQGDAIIFSGGSNTLTLNGGSLSGSIDIQAGSLTFNQSTARTLDNAIIGGGAVIQNGTGALTLTGTNTYTGVTSINAGATLALSGTGSIAASSGVTDNGTFGISGLTNGGTPIVTLSGSGAVALGANKLTLSNASGIFSGIIGGSGSLSQTAGTETLTGANTYTGGTSLNGGTIVVGNNSALGTSTLAMAAGTTLSFLNDNFTIANAITITGDPNFTPPSGTTQTLSGVISGSGTLTMGGAGTLVLSADNTYTGPTDVNAGTLDVTDSIASSSLTSVASGATLTGTGTIGNLQIAGMFAPGSGAPGSSMTVSGNLAFQSGALYLVFLNPGTSTFANVVGTASLAGTVHAVFAPGTYLTKQYVILQSAGLSGTFSGISTTNLPADFDASLSYTSDDVLLDLSPELGLSVALNKNQRNVANAINSYFGRVGTLPANFANLFNLTGTNLANALTQIDGENATGAERGAFDLMNEFLGLMLDPFVYGRGGSGAGGAALGFAPDQQANLPPDIALAYAGVLKAPPSTTFNQRWSTWGSGFGGSGTTNGDPSVGSNNVTTSTYGYAGGMDYHYSPDTVVGFALAGGGTNWDLAQGLGTGRSDAFLAGVHGVTHNGPAYLAAALAFANNWFTTNRTALGDQLTANFQGQSYSARLEGGYRFVLPVYHGAVGVTPYAAIQAQDFRTPAYSEIDLSGGGFGLSYAAMNGTDTRSELGGRFDDLTALGAMPLMLRAKVAWAHDWVSNPALSASFESLPGTSFTVFGAPIPHNSALASTGAQLFFTPNWSLLAKFDGEFASGSQLYAGSGTLRYTW